MPLRKNRFVFTGERQPHVKSRTLQHVSERINDTLKYPRFTPHDLRRTAATHIRKLGIARDVVQRLLNHAEEGVTAVYDRHDLLPELRTALDKWSEEMCRITEQPPPEVKAVALGRK